MYQILDGVNQLIYFRINANIPNSWKKDPKRNGIRYVTCCNTSFFSKILLSASTTWKYPLNFTHIDLTKMISFRFSLDFSLTDHNISLRNNLIHSSP